MGARNEHVIGITNDDGKAAAYINASCPATIHAQVISGLWIATAVLDTWVTSDLVSISNPESLSALSLCSDTFAEVQSSTI